LGALPLQQLSKIDLKLSRDYCKNFTIGRLTLNLNNKTQQWCTLELPWLDNSKNRSCIPENIYQCEIYSSKKFGLTRIIKQVENRTGILFHAGNTTADTNGCILIGKHFSYLDNKIFLYQSKIATQEFLFSLKDFKSVQIKIEG
jgi:Family of unknown function (DUF5675)